MNKNELQESATQLHSYLRRAYESWQELEKIAENHGFTIDTKTAEVKEK